MVIKLLLKNETPIKFIYKDLYIKILDAIASQEQIDHNGQVNVVIVTDLAMQKLHYQYKNQNKVTDILSFPAAWQELLPYLGYYEFGDIYIAANQIKQQALSYGHSQKREWCYIFTHGVFHLLGYDHQTEMAAAIMNQKVAQVMTLIKVGRDD